MSAASEVTAPIPPVAGYHHVSLTVTDIDASETWYRTVFGMERAMVERHEDGGGHAVVLNRPGTSLFLGLTHHDRNDGERFEERRTGLDHFSVAVTSREELDQWLVHLDKLSVPNSGIAERREPFPYALIVFRDPDDIQLEVTWS